MADIVYNRAKNNIDISDLRIMLLVSYTPNPDHATITAVKAAATKECDFTNYARKALTGEAFTVDNAADTGKLDADDPATWAGAGGVTNNTISHAVIYEHHGASDDDNLPVTCHEVGKATNGTDLIIELNTSGIHTTS